MFQEVESSLYRQKETLFSTQLLCHQIVDIGVTADREDNLAFDAAVRNDLTPVSIMKQEVRDLYIFWDKIHTEVRQIIEDKKELIFSF